MNTTATATISTATATPEFMAYFDQVIEADGRSNVVLAEADEVNGSGRVIGTVYTVPADVVEFITEALALGV